MVRRPRKRAATLWHFAWRTALLLCALVVLGGVAGALYLMTGLPKTTGTVRVAGLGDAVDVLRDRDGVPHIFASNINDAYQALGYVHAQDRLVQMELMRRFGAGRLSEVLGPATLDTDRWMRTLGVYRAAEKSFDKLDVDTRRALEAYARGVNAYLADRRGALPPELIAIGGQPESWRPADSLVWARIMALTLAGNWRDELLRARLARRLPKERWEELFRPNDPEGAVSLKSASANLDLPRLNMPAIPREVDLAAAKILERFPTELEPRKASNAWVSAGRNTATGKPILVNDPHLSFSLPIIWYLARIDTPEVKLTGATVPGVPFHVLGHNDRIAWGLTTTGADTQDVFIERLTSGDAAKYDTPDGPKAFETRSETIEVKGAPAVRIAIRSTRHGPVISDVNAAARDLAGTEYVLALQTTALSDEDSSPAALRKLTRAGDWAGFRGALGDFIGPMQNFMFAAQDGTIGLIGAGRLPLRARGTGSVPSEGWTGAGDWVGTVPFDGMPQTTDPASGRLVNANNRLVDAAYPYMITRNWDVPYRADRIQEVLAERGPQTIASSRDLLADIASPMSADMLPVLLAGNAEGSPLARAARRMLTAWDGTMRHDRPEPLVFAAWMRSLTYRVVLSKFGELADGFWAPDARTMKRLLTENSPWCDDPGTGVVETCTDAINQSLEDAMQRLAARHGADPARWRWGDEHKAQFTHPLFGRVPGLRDLVDIKIAADGGFDTVNRGAYRFGRPDEDFADVHGAGYRAIYDLANPDRSLYSLATGQSGHPLSGHFKDFVKRWRSFAMRPIAGTRGQLINEGAERLTLTPGN